ncbi:MAG: MFS transporter [Micromonosporaceae bacterium]|nr:MFS transporter [Micromonosporaceae bacterium]
MAPRRRTWLRPQLVALMIAAAAATFVLSATEIAAVATLTAAGVQQWAGLAIALWCGYSLVGGLVFGALRRPVSALTLVAAMAALTMPVGLASSWPWIMLALLPSGVLCAPSVTAANDNLTRIVPPAARGEANGLLGSAFTIGVAAGAPFAGAIIDGWGAEWAFAAAGGVAVLIVLAAVPAYRRGDHPAVEPATSPGSAGKPATAPRAGEAAGVPPVSEPTAV